ncbi:MAG: MFS transporter, partial [Candidatus Latescibacterota bacterium]
LKYQNTPKPFAYARLGIARTIATAAKVKQFKHLLLFLIAFMVYDDGIQTVITMATMYGASELGLDASSLMLTLLIIQFVAAFGASFFGWLGGRFGAKRALLLTLLLWSGVVVYAYFLTTAAEYMFLGVVVGLCMGGSQALSRSLYGSMVPVQASAEFYGFYSVFSKFSAIWGPLVFGIVRQTTGSSRNSILAIIVFFLLGIVLLSLVNVEKAREARNSEIFGEEGAIAGIDIQ